MPETLDGCIVRAPETIQERFFFGVLMEAGIVLSGKEARDYNRTTSSFRGKKKRGGRTATESNDFKIQVSKPSWLSQFQF